MSRFEFDPSWLVIRTLLMLRLVSLVEYEAAAGDAQFRG